MPVVMIDNGGANIASVRVAFARLGAEVSVSSDVEEIRFADGVVLPGVGAAGDGMRRLRASGLDEVIPRLTQPVLGVCLGMQLLFERSAENAADCLHVMEGSVQHLQAGSDVRVPHMGWNRLRVLKNHSVFNGISDDDWFYFVHSYAAPLGNSSLASTRHGEEFCAVAGMNNFVAAQFHPERSGRAGAQILKNFLEWDGCN
ncbi:MAG: imidazole glycerol phosphate synthase subunit HisH [Proteobacteria bacterium]|nr:imidazole glycerol phosphate synthase subunit HisH [Pseudomonadota bacterium]